MNAERAICFNCEHWAAEPGVLDEKHRTISRKLADGEKEVPPEMYGKCKAIFIDQVGEEIRLDMGTLAPTNCIASDDNGNILFEPVPID